MKTLMTAAIVAASFSTVAMAGEKTDKQLVANTSKIVKQLGAIAESNAKTAEALQGLTETLIDGPLDRGALRANLTSLHDLPVQMMYKQTPLDRYFGQPGPKGVVVWMGKDSRVKTLISNLNQFCGVFGKQYKAMYSNTVGVVQASDCDGDNPDGKPWCYLKDMFKKPLLNPVHIDKVVCEYKLLDKRVSN